METKKDLKTLLKENDVHYPKVWAWLYFIGTSLTTIAMLLFVVTPLIKYGNGTTVTEDKTYSIFKLLTLQNGNPTLILILMAIIFIGIAFAVLVAVGVFGYLNSYFTPVYKKVAAKQSILLTNKKLQKVLMIVGTIFAIIACGLLLCLTIFVSDFDEFANPYWEVETAWGTYVTLIFAVAGLSCGITPLFNFMVYKNQYENDRITDEQVLALFQKKQKEQTVTDKPQVVEEPKQSLEQQLEELKRLQEKGLISEEEYEEKKKKLLGL